MHKADDRPGEYRIRNDSECGERNDVWCTDEEANQTADWLSENKYSTWCTIRELLNEF